MMMKKMAFMSLLCALAMPVLADSESYFLNEGDRRQWGSDDGAAFVETKMALPPVPDSQQGDWFTFYVDKMQSSQPAILLSSITTAPDGSIRYILNNRSASGSDNMTAEGIFCVTGLKLLDSDSTRIKTFGYADTVNNRWIEPRRSEWQVLDTKRNNYGKVRRVVYDAFCLNDKKVLTDDELRARMREQSAKPEFGYGR